jgi:hypothetical protein
MIEKRVRVPKFAAQVIPPDENPGPQPNPSKLQLLLKSRKFWAALVGLVLIIVKGMYPDLVLDEDAVVGIVLVLVAYITGTALEDGLRGRG